MGTAHTDEDYYPCSACLGYFKKTYLWRHKKICTALKGSEKPKIRTNHLSEAQTFIAATGLLGCYLEKSRLRLEVFPIMKPDEISFIVKSDPLICLYGESYLNKHKRKQMNVVASNRIREIARLTLMLQQITTIRNSMDFLKPDMYENIITATKMVCGFKAETKKYKAPSLALHFGTNLKFLCDVAKKAVITIASHWCNDVSSLASKLLNEAAIQKPQLVPLTEDIKCFNNYILSLASDAFNCLKSNVDIQKNYKYLAECTMCLVLVFYRKRIGEVQFLEIDVYERESPIVNQNEFLNSLTEFEKSMSSFFKRVVVFGKGSKPVPILFTKQMQKYIDCLLEIRQKTAIVPKGNKYVFANPGSNDRWISGSQVVRKFAYKCGAKNPALLTSTKFRKQIATILQLMSFQQNEMEQIARFMGHSEKTHREFYRLTEDTYQTAKVVKVLLLLNAGKGEEFKGKCLDDIEVGQDIVEYDKQDEMNENENEDHNNGLSNVAKGKGSMDNSNKSEDQSKLQSTTKGKRSSDNSTRVKINQNLNLLN